MASLIALMLVALFGLTSCGIEDPNGSTASTPTPTPLLSPWERTVSQIRWVAYSPTNADPNAGVEPTLDSVRQDLAVLREAGFDGLVTYSASGIIGSELPAAAELLGFEGLLVGVWDPSNTDEMAAAAKAATSPVVVGYVVGNEGLHRRYELAELKSAMGQLRQATGKPVTTTEEIDDYSDPALLGLGDWVFPNAHPYFHGQVEPALAVRWTRAAFEDLVRRTDRFVMFKEVGLPTAGDPTGQLSETNQRDYYQELVQTQVRFVYFEAFDMTWKTTPSVEPHWGLFRADRTPKLLAGDLLTASGSTTDPGHSPAKAQLDLQNKPSGDHPE